jgi:hypothetical protein
VRVDKNSKRQCQVSLGSQTERSICVDGIYDDAAISTETVDILRTVDTQLHRFVGIVNVTTNNDSRTDTEAYDVRYAQWWFWPIGRE